MKKSVISLISYDAKYLPESINTYYEYVDEIILGLDKNRITWNQNPFQFDENRLWQDLSNIDGDNKIKIIEESFHPSNVSISNDTYERNYLKEQCSHNCILSIDADEELVNAKDFFYKFFPLVENYIDKYDIAFRWVLPWKNISPNTLFITKEDGSVYFEPPQSFLTTKNKIFRYSRFTCSQKTLSSPLVILHWSLCRSEEELEFKIHNTGHSDMADRDPFFHNWKMTTMENYHLLRNFKTHGMGREQWPMLTSIPMSDMRQWLESQLHMAY